MPLEFESLSHSKIAFGFFNIETDMILLNQYFLSAEDFCRYIVQASESSQPLYETLWEVYWIENGMDIGNLMDAIEGTDLRGFIGEVYSRYPFPKFRENFKQNPEGFKTRPIVEELIQRYAKRITIRFIMDNTKGQGSIGEYLFNKTQFQKLIHYIWLGGLPRWKDDVRPDYVLTMREKMEKSVHPLFDGLNV
ncbi:MAG: hypothetical protein KG012_06710 [Deltaproteobacteria bacterium]|nr:hypothetical protein [Deltaproteobacteria bacterium]